MSGESVFLFHALLTGAFITLVYDGLIIWRRVIPHKPVAEALEDLAYWIFCAIYVFMWLYRESNGTLRWYAVAGALLGMMLYKKTISRYLVKGMTWFLKKVLAILGKVLYVVLTPVRYLRRQTAKWQEAAKKRRRKFYSKVKIRLKSFLKALKIRLCKQ